MNKQYKLPVGNKLFTDDIPLKYAEIGRDLSRILLDAGNGLYTHLHNNPHETFVDIFKYKDGSGIGLVAIYAVKDPDLFDKLTEIIEKHEFEFVENL